MCGMPIREPCKVHGLYTTHVFIAADLAPIFHA
jgi:hypothetical protein